MAPRTDPGGHPDPAGRTDPGGPTDPAGRTGRGGRTDRGGLARPLGFAAIVAGLALNPWFFLWLAPDGDIESRVILGAIVAFDLALIGLGLWLIRSRPRIGAADLALTGASLLFVLVLLEAGFRVGVAAGPQGSSLHLTDGLGWAAKPFYERVRTRDPVHGDVHYTTTRDGFRRFGDPAADRTKILFIGDSYTQATQVSDGEAFYDHIADRRDDVEVFAYGAGGYGSLQEYMILDAYFDEIRPDLVVWQFTPNDVMNNSYALESRSAFNSRMPRPYLEDDGIVVRFPSRNPLVRHTRLGRFVSIRLGFVGTDNEDFVERSIEYRIDDRRDLWDDAVRTTERIMRRVVERAGDVPVVAFEVSPSYLDEDLFPRICERVGILFIDGVRAALDSALAAGVAIDFRPHDRHWGPDGHAVVGERILQFLVGRDLLTREEA